MENSSLRVQRLIDDRLIDVYRASVEHFGSTDLVLIFDESKEIDPVDSFKRLPLYESPDIPAFLKSKLCKPAKQALGKLNHAEVAFWFVVFFKDGESICTAVKATLMGKAGKTKRDTHL